MVLTRRRVLQLGGLSAAALAGVPIWFASRRASAAIEARTPLLVLIFLRGGADGLHLVPPIGDPEYARARGSLALAKTLPFVEGFGLHPALAPLQPLVERGELAAVHAVGSSDRSRSHFEAQDLMELADPERRGGGTGWLARAMAGTTDEGPFATLALAGGLPLSLRGSGAFAIGDPSQFGLSGADTNARARLERRYTDAAGDPFAEAGLRALGALSEFEHRTGRSPQGLEAPETRSPARRKGRRADPPLSERIRQLLELDQARLGIRAVALECHGWDTHQRQGTETGSMTRPIQELASGMASLADALRGRRDWLAVAITEFGRTVRPNGSQGSDHGHGGVTLIAGPGVKPGVHGPWPGLTEGALHEGRDLAVATDYRHVLFEVLSATLRTAPPPQTFPGFAPKPLGLLA